MNVGMNLGLGAARFKEICFSRRPRNPSDRNAAAGYSFLRVRPMVFRSRLFLRHYRNKPVPGHHRFDFLQIRRATSIDDGCYFPEMVRPDECRRPNRKGFYVCLLQIVEVSHRTARNKTILAGSDVSRVKTWALSAF